MTEYIEREALLKAVSAWRMLVKDLYYCGYDDCITAMEDTISDAPAADVEPVRRGHWIINSDGYYPQCSECMKEPQGRVMTDWCPNCGAKMGGEENGK